VRVLPGTGGPDDPGDVEQQGEANESVSREAPRGRHGAPPAP